MRGAAHFRERALQEARRYGSDPLVLVRELLQNARDAGATTVAFVTGADAGTVRLSCRDDGHGLTFDGAERSLFTLYASRKTRADAGRFGVGFWSVLLFEPARLVVRSWPRKGAPWEAEWDGDLEQARARRPPAASRGTEVVLERAGDADPADAVFDAAWRHARFLRRRDGRAPLEVTVNGRRVSAELALPAPSLQFRRRGLRGVVGPRRPAAGRAVREGPAGPHRRDPRRPAGAGRARARGGDRLGPAGHRRALRAGRGRARPPALARRRALGRGARARGGRARGALPPARPAARARGRDASRPRGGGARRPPARRSRRRPRWRLSPGRARARTRRSTCGRACCRRPVPRGLPEADGRGTPRRPCAPIATRVAPTRGPCSTAPTGRSSAWPCATRPPSRCTSRRCASPPSDPTDGPQVAREPIGPYAGGVCTRGCVAIRMTAAGGAWTSLPVPTGHRLDPEQRHGGRGAGARVDRRRRDAARPAAGGRRRGVVSHGPRRRARAARRRRWRCRRRCGRSPVELRALPPSERPAAAAAWVRAHVRDARAGETWGATSRRRATASTSRRPRSRAASGTATSRTASSAACCRRRACPRGWPSATSASPGPRPPGCTPGWSTARAEVRGASRTRAAPRSRPLRRRPRRRRPPPRPPGLRSADGLSRPRPRLSSALSPRTPLWSRRTRRTLRLVRRARRGRARARGAAPSRARRARGGALPPRPRPLPRRRALALARAGAGGRRRAVRRAQADAARARAARQGACVVDGSQAAGRAVADALGAVDLDAWSERLDASDDGGPLLARVNRGLREAGARFRVRAGAGVGAPCVLDLPRSRDVLLDAATPWLAEAFGQGRGASGRGRARRGRARRRARRPAAGRTGSAARAVRARGAPRGGTLRPPRLAIDAGRGRHAAWRAARCRGPGRCRRSWRGARCARAHAGWTCAAGSARSPCPTTASRSTPPRRPRSPARSTRALPPRTATRRSRRWRRGRTRSCATWRRCRARGSCCARARAASPWPWTRSPGTPSEARGWLRSVGRFAGGRIALDGATLPGGAPAARRRGAAACCRARAGCGCRRTGEDGALWLMRGRHRERVPGGAERDPVRGAGRPQRVRARLGRRRPAAGGGGGRRGGARRAGRAPGAARRGRAAVRRRAPAAPAPAPAGRGAPAPLPERGAARADLPRAHGRRRALAQPRRARPPRRCRARTGACRPARRRRSRRRSSCRRGRRSSWRRPSAPGCRRSWGCASACSRAPSRRSAARGAGPRPRPSPACGPSPAGAAAVRRAPHARRADAAGRDG